MTFSEIADIADLIAAAGVIASLIFVAVQIRENTRTTKNTHWENHLNRLAGNFSRPAEPALADVLVRGKKSFFGLNDVEKTMFSAWANEYMLSTSLLLVFREQGAISSELSTTADRRLTWFFASSGAVEWWRHELRHPVPEQIEKIIEDWLANNDR